MSLPSNLPDFLKPTLKLFLSVDLIGSTKLKHDEDVLYSLDPSITSLDGIGARWFRFLIDFYSGFEEKFTEEWKTATDTDGIAKPHWNSTSTPTLWKVNGDELIYVLTVSHPGQIVVALYSWKEALLKYRKSLHKKNASLDVKATAWMAGFPIGNHEVAFWNDLSNAQLNPPEHAGKLGQYMRLNEWYDNKAKGKESVFVKDYIGPAVDTGFRISSFATARKFPVSVEVAYFLSKLPFDDEVKEKIALRYHGRESMKGVLSGIPYPIFWIDTASPEDELTKAEDKLIAPAKPCIPLDMRRYIELFFSDAKNKLFRPFIHGCKDQKFSDIPEKYSELLSHTAEIWHKEVKKIQIQNQPDAPPDGIDEQEMTLGEILAQVKKIIQDD